MQNQNIPTKNPTGLLQSTQFTGNGTITITCVTGDESRELVSFTDVPEVLAFYRQRGVAPGITQPTNPVSIRVLALDLMKLAEQKRAANDPTADEFAEHARNLHAAANTVQKGDALLASYVVPRPLTV